MTEMVRRESGEEIGECTSDSEAEAKHAGKAWRIKDSGMICRNTEVCRGEVRNYASLVYSDVLSVSLSW